MKLSIRQLPISINLSFRAAAGLEMKQKIRPSRSLWRGVFILRARHSSKGGGDVPTSDFADLSAKFQSKVGATSDKPGLVAFSKCQLSG
jgi:hypothetical protein